MTERVAAIVPAAGIGSRLAADESTEAGRTPKARTPKALRLLVGEPLLRHAIRSLEHAVAQVVIPAAADSRADVERAIAQVGVPVVVVDGGVTREESVRRSLSALDPTTTHVLVHDAARPLAPPAVTDRVLSALREGAEAVVPVIEVVDTLRRTAGSGSHPMDRAEVRAVQTPQGFTVDVLRRAHQGAAEPVTASTDDASLAERIGVDVVLVEGDPLAFKVTRALDLVLAEAVVGQST